MDVGFLLLPNRANGPSSSIDQPLIGTIDGSHPIVIKDMAVKIEAGWKKLLAQEQQQVKQEGRCPLLRVAYSCLTSGNLESKADVRSKKRKAEAPAGTSKTAATFNAAQPTGGAGAPPATKKAAVATATGTKAVRRDSLNTGPSTTSASTVAATGAVSAKPVQSDSSFFSAKPKAKLPSFRKKPVAVASTVKTEGEGESKIAQPQAQLPNDYNPFADALKAVRKGSPVVPPNSTPNQGTAVGPGEKVAAISAKTGKPKKVVRFRPDGELEMVKFIERAIYDDDIPGGTVSDLLLRLHGFVIDLG